MFFNDLSPCNDYFDCEEPTLLAVGWLDGQHPFQTGFCPREVFDSLVDIFSRLRTPHRFMGDHYCELCGFDSEGFPRSWKPSSKTKTQFTSDRLFSGDAFIPSEEAGTFYVAPHYIIHYINVHYYLPPVCFQKAVINCPDIEGELYETLLSSYGMRL